MTAAPSGRHAWTWLRAGMILDPLTLLLSLLSLLLGLFVLFFGLLLGLLHLLQRLLLLLLSLIVAVIGGEATAADQAWWGLRKLRAEGTVGRHRHGNGNIRQAN